MDLQFVNSETRRPDLRARECRIKKENHHEFFDDTKFEFDGGQPGGRSPASSIEYD